MKSYIAFLPVLFLSLLACSPDFRSHQTPLPPTSDSVIGGDEIHQRLTEAAKSVVAVEMTNHTGQVLAFCTGTLIGTNTVLTAGHCFDKELIPSIGGFNIVFTDKYSYFGNSTTRKGAKWSVHTSYNSTKKEFDHDIAVASFVGSLPEGYMPVAYDTDTKTDHSNGTVYVYGYGRSRDYTGRRNQNVMEYLGQLNRGVMQIDSNYNRHPDRYWTNPDIPIFICQGDSGGPQFYHENGVLKLMGVNSAVYGPKLPNGRTSCKGVSQATKVAPFAEWIKKTRASFILPL